MDHKWGLPFHMKCRCLMYQNVFPFAYEHSGYFLMPDPKEGRGRERERELWLAVGSMKAG